MSKNEGIAKTNKNANDDVPEPSASDPPPPANDRPATPPPPRTDVVPPTPRQDKPAPAPAHNYHPSFVRVLAYNTHVIFVCNNEYKHKLHEML